MKKISRRKIAEYLADELNNGANVKELAQKATAYLQDEGQLGQVELLLRDVEDVLATKYNTVAMHVTSARPLDLTSSKQLVAFIKEVEKADEAVIVSETVDEALIGGVVIKTPEKVLDSSVQSKLKQLVATAKG